VELADGSEREAEVGDARRIDTAEASEAPPAVTATDAEICGGEDERSWTESSEAEKLKEAAGEDAA